MGSSGPAVERLLSVRSGPAVRDRSAVFEATRSRESSLRGAVKLRSRWRHWHRVPRVHPRAETRVVQLRTAVVRIRRVVGRGLVPEMVGTENTYS